MNKGWLYLKDKRQATWLELFFDLIFVVAIGKITHYLAHTHHHHLDAHAWPQFFLTFIPLWWIWVTHTVYSNRFDSDARSHRATTLFLMFLLIIISVVLSGDLTQNYRVFIGIYALIRLCLAGMHFGAAKKYQDRAQCAHRIGYLYSAGALICGSAMFFEMPIAIFVFYGGLLVDMVSPLLLHKQIKALPAHKHHLVERVGLLAIIMLGESIISMSGGLSSVSWTPLTIATATCGFSIVIMIWWIYFDSFALLIESERDKNGDAILLSQLLTYLSLAILANVIRHGILNELSLAEFRVMAITGMVLFYLGKQIAYFINVPEYRNYILINTFCVYLIAGLSLLLPAPQYILMGLTFSMMVYIGLNYRAQIKLYGSAKM